MCPGPGSGGTIPWGGEDNTEHGSIDKYYVSTSKGRAKVDLKSESTSRERLPASRWRQMLGNVE